MLVSQLLTWCGFRSASLRIACVWLLPIPTAAARLRTDQCVSPSGGGEQAVWKTRSRSSWP
jgi:hypothetical protein